MYGSETITYLNAVLSYRASTNCLPPHIPIWNRTLELLNYHIYFKSKEEPRMAEKPSHLKQLSINHVCKIGLKGQCHRWCTLSKFSRKKFETALMGYSGAWGKLIQ
jgi:hypothetical protein